MEPLFVVTGATGKTGSTVIRKLLSAGKRVRAVGRTKERLEPLADAGADPFVCDLGDKKALARAFSGARAIYAMIPPDMASQDYRSYQNHITDSLAAALKKSRAEYVVALSSLGAEHSTKTGPIAGLHYMEQQFNAMEAVNVLHLRAGYFMENLLAQVAIIKATGYVSDTLRPDLALPMIASRDIGSAAAEALLRPTFSGRQIRDLVGPRDISMAQAAAVIGDAIGKPELQYVQCSENDARNALIQMGISTNVADLLMEMSAAMNSGLVAAPKVRQPNQVGPTSLEEFVREHFVPAYRGMASGR